MDEGTLSFQEQRRMVFLGRRSLASVSGWTSERRLRRAALDDGRSVNLAGGTHHTFRDDGAGYCVFNDGAVAARAVTLARADLAIFVTGVDPYASDQLGRLSLSRDGLAARDRMVFDACDRCGIPVAVPMTGGYAPT